MGARFSYHLIQEEKSFQTDYHKVDSLMGTLLYTHYVVDVVPRVLGTADAHIRFFLQFLQSSYFNLCTFLAYADVGVGL